MSGDTLVASPVCPRVVGTKWLSIVAGSSAEDMAPVTVGFLKGSSL